MKESIDRLKKKWSDEVRRQIAGWINEKTNSYFLLRKFLSYADLGIPLLLTGKLDLFLGKHLSFFSSKNPILYQDSIPPSDANSCAVVVTFHPDEAVLQNLKLLANQFKQVFIVDNTPLFNAKFFEIITLEFPAKITLLSHRNEKGLAGAVNLGLRSLLKNHSSGWVFWFDQDSKITENFLESIQNILKLEPTAEMQNTLFGVNYSQSNYGLPKTDLTEVDNVITSGSFMRIENLHRIGLYIDELFIDSLDHEYSMRAKRFGMKIKLVGSYLMQHSLGVSEVKHLAFGKNVTITNHSPLRWYFFTRNLIFLTLEGFPKSYAWGFEHAISLLKNAIKVIAFEKPKFKKLWGACKGIGAGFALFFGLK